MKKWFPASSIKEKRKEIQQLLVRLAKELNPAAAPLLKLLGTDEEMDTSDKNDCEETTLPSSNVEAKPPRKLEQDFSRTQVAEMAEITQASSDSEPLAD